MQRTLSIQSPAIPVLLGQSTLEAVRLSGNEGLNSLFAYELLLKTPDALNLGASGAMDFDLDLFIGREITCLIQLDGAGQFVPGVAGQALDHIGAGVRQINALITDVEVRGEEGRHVQYKLTLRPWLHLATLTTDCRIYQNKTVVQILDELLASYDFPVDKRLIETYPTRDYQVQFNESDFEFFERLTQSRGISYFFQHSEGKHRLVLIDNMGAYQKNDSAAYQQVEYHAPGWKVDAEYVSSFVPHHHLTSGRYASREYDYMRPRADLGQSRKDPRANGQADGEVYQWHEGSAAGSHYAQPRAGSAEANDPHGEGHRLALLRMEALRTHGARARASGNLRGMAPGCSFELQKHPRQKANAEYLILDTRFLIEDVAQDSQIGDAAPGRKQQWKVEVDFTAHPMAEPLRPVPTRPKPLTHGPQTARVVGPPGQNIWTDKWGRIKVQFPWDRIGGEDQHSSCWIRVNLHGAGNQQGSIHVPRIGQEVIVDFVGGDPDLPICTGRAYNQANEPPWALPHHSALSGYRSRELTDNGGNSSAGRSNHIAMDDTKGKIQVQIKSDHQHSQLSLGHITRIEDNAGRKDDRGQGAELRTDGHAVIRARQGMLLTTEGRANAEAHITDMEETSARLAIAQAQHEALANAAIQATAQDDQDQLGVTQALKAQTDAVKGKGPTGQSADGAFPELIEPHLVLASPAGIEATTAKTAHIAAGEHVALTSGGHISLGSSASLLASAKKAIKLFAYQQGMKLISYAADIELKALQTSINLIAKLDITLTANRIEITAKKEISLNGGGSKTTWNAEGIVHRTAGRLTAHTASFQIAGPQSVPVQIPPTTPVGVGLQDEAFILKDSETGQLLANVKYRVMHASGIFEEGVTDAAGRTHVIRGNDPEALTIEIQLEE